MDIPDNRDKEGEWNEYRNGNNEVMYSCSECNIQSKVGYWYCPGCGAKMKFQYYCFNRDLTKKGARSNDD